MYVHIHTHLHLYMHTYMYVYIYIYTYEGSSCLPRDKSEKGRRVAATNKTKKMKEAPAIL